MYRPGEAGPRRAGNVAHIEEVHDGVRFLMRWPHRRELSQLGYKVLKEGLHNGFSVCKTYPSIAFPQRVVYLPGEARPRRAACATHVEVRHDRVRLHRWRLRRRRRIFELGYYARHAALVSGVLTEERRRQVAHRCSATKLFFSTAEQTSLD